MAKLTEGRASALRWDGAMPLPIMSEKISGLSQAQANKKGGFVPWDAYLEELWALVITAASQADATTLNVGNVSTVGKYVSGIPVLALSIAGMRWLDLTQSYVMTRDIPAGNFVEFGTTAATAGTAVAVVAFTAILVPKSAVA